MNITDALAHYGATARMKQASFSAFAKDGSLVVALWQRFIIFPPEMPGVWRYQDTFSRIIDPGRGVREFAENLYLAKAQATPLRLIVAHVDNPADWEKIVNSDPACKIKKSFTVEDKRIGKVVTITDDLHIIDFIRTEKPAKK